MPLANRGGGQVRRGIEAGRFRSEAVAEALSLWEERERIRSGILASVAEAEASLARGEGIVLETEQEVRDFANDIKQRGRARLQGEKARNE